MSCGVRGLKNFKGGHIEDSRAKTHAHQVGAAVLSWNHPHITERALVSAQAKFEDHQIYLIHNGSLLKHREYLQGNFPSIQHRMSEVNRGYAGGVNMALTTMFEDSNLEWAVLLTNDCEILTEVEVSKNPGLYGATILRSDSQTLEACGGLLDWTTLGLRHLKEPWEFERYNHLGHSFESYVTGHAFLIHRQAFEILGPFDENLFTYWEDVDYSLRARRLGVSLGVLPAWQVRHLGGKTCRKKPIYSSYYFPRNRQIIADRYQK